MNGQFIAVNDKLTAIEKQTTKTNGRVSVLEDNVVAIEKEMIKHPLECSKGKDIDVIKEDLLEYRMLKRYPKVFVFLFVVLIGITLYKAFNRDKRVYDEITQMKWEIKTKIDQIDGYSKTTRSGYVPYIDNGLIDSVKVR